MTKYLLSFPERAMEVPAEDFAAVGVGMTSRADGLTGAR
jgi:hypothetical protein